MLLFLLVKQLFSKTCGRLTLGSLKEKQKQLFNKLIHYWFICSREMDVSKTKTIIFYVRRTRRTERLDPDVVLSTTVGLNVHKHTHLWQRHTHTDRSLHPLVPLLLQQGHQLRRDVPPGTFQWFSPQSTNRSRETSTTKERKKNQDIILYIYYFIFPKYDKMCVFIP